MARRRKATKAEIIKRILDEDAQREEETGYGFALDMGGRQYAREALESDSREELLKHFEGTWDGYFWEKDPRKNPRNSTGYVRAKIRANSARKARQNASPSWEKHHTEAIRAHGKRLDHVLGFEGVPAEDRNLSGLDLSNANLFGANLERADLRRADLPGADLQGAELADANLQGANLQGADLRGANLYQTNLFHADLRGADLEGVINFENAILAYANLFKATGLTSEQIAYAKKHKAIFEPQ